jgi:hypothetical protein
MMAEKAKGKRQKTKGKRAEAGNFCLLSFAFCLLPSLLPGDAATIGAAP